MPIEIRIWGDNAAEVLNEVYTIANTTRSEIINFVSETTPEPVVVEAAPVVAEPAPEPEPKKRGGRPKKEAAPVSPPPPPPPAPEPTPEPEPEPAATEADEDLIEDLDDLAPADAPLEVTLSDVRNVGTDYANKYGIEAAQKDLLPVLREKAGVGKMSELDGKPQEILQAVYLGFSDLLLNNPHGHQPANKG